MTELQLQAFLAIVIPQVVQLLKSVPWFPFANFSSGSLNRVFSWFVAAATGLGIAFKYDPAVGQLLITGLTLAGITQGVGHMLFQLAINHASYKAMIAPPLPGIQQALARDTGVLVPIGGHDSTKEPPVPAPVPEFSVGAAIDGTTHLFNADPRDPLPIGQSRNVGGVEYRRIQPTVYERQ
jgi:hypothetical protein